MEVGLSEAKTKLSELCRKVAETGEAIVITQRGRPLVRIESAEKEKNQHDTVWARREMFERSSAPVTEEFVLPDSAKQTWYDPLAE